MKNLVLILNYMLVKNYPLSGHFASYVLLLVHYEKLLKILHYVKIKSFISRTTRSFLKGLAFSHTGIENKKIDHPDSFIYIPYGYHHLFSGLIKLRVIV